MITGYFMCTSKITARKFIKLLAQIYFYNIVIYFIFLAFGYEAISVVRIVKLLMPFWGFGGDFIECFIVFYLTIPFWTILVQNMNIRQHGLLLILLLGCYTILGSIPTFRVTYNYITWFGIIFLIASYIRLYPMQIYENKKLWRRLTLISVVLSMASVALLDKYFNAGYFLISDCNKLFAVVVAVCSFLWFKKMNIKYNKVINAFGSATFGVLLIHANPGVMGLWLWKDFINAPSFYQLPFERLVLASFGVVLAVFIICNLLDQIRIATMEKAFLKWYDKHIDIKLNKLIKSEQYV